MSPTVDPHYSTEERASKRTRQACEPCRRKKSKCTGERPVCSTCGRLQQQCLYAPESQQAQPFEQQSEPPQQRLPTTAPSVPPSAIFTTTLPTPGAQDATTLHNRVQSLEAALAEVVQALKNGSQPQTSPRSSDTGTRQSYDERPVAGPAVILPHPENTVASVYHQQQQQQQQQQHCYYPKFTLPAMPPWATVHALANNYVAFCNCQPLPLLDSQTFIDAFSAPSELAYSLLALTARFSDDPWVERQDMRCVRGRSLYSQTAHRIIMERVAEGSVELPTIQALCVLSFVEFFDGDSVSSRIHISLAMSLVTCALPARVSRASSHEEDEDACDPSKEAEARRRCYWSVVFLQRLVGDAANSPETPVRLLPSYPDSPSAPPVSALSPEGQRVASSFTTKGHGNRILATVLQLSEVWARAQSYIRTRGTTEDPYRLWDSQSQHSRILQMVMSVSQRLAPIHCYRCIRLAAVATSEFETHADYWTPWFLSRFLYHGVLCLLNHPLLITMQLQKTKVISEVFLQQTSFNATHHTAWILQFLEFFESRGLRPTDPIMGYCAAVVASIELQLSFSETFELSRRRKDNYERCLKFIGRQATFWPYMQKVGTELERLRTQMDSSYESRRSDLDHNVTIDISGFFEILDLAGSSRPNGSNGARINAILGPSLSNHQPPASLPDPARLAPLPPITYMGDTSPQTNLGVGGGAAGSDFAMDPAHFADDELLVPVEQFFEGARLQSVNDWWQGAFTEPDTGGANGGQA